MGDGYMGKLLYLDATNWTYHEKEIDSHFKRTYLGGNGFGAYLLYTTVKAGIDPLGEKNALIFATGPLTGTPFSSAAMTAVVTKSPLTGCFLDSYMGGHFGTEIKQAGYDAIIIEGASDTPVFIYINDGYIEFRDANHIWGMNTFETQRLLSEDLGSNTEIACIGPAGENLVKYASIISRTRAAGRGGAGAVLGAKKIKAIAINGTQTIPVDNISQLIELTYKNNEKLKNHPVAGKSFPTYGSTAAIASYSAMGILGTKNWQTETFPEVEKISGEYNKAKGLLVRSRACSSCIIRSSKIWKTGKGAYAGIIAEGPEYETQFSFGSNCGNSCFDAIIAADRLCDELGMDTLTAGGTIAFAMECFEKGYLTLEDTGGLDLTFGNHHAITDLIPKIAYRQELGDLLAEGGSKRMSEKLDPQTQKFSMHVKGYEFAGHSARAFKGQAVGYATSNRGASHQDTRMALERKGTYNRLETGGKGKFAKETQDMTTIGDCLVVCRRATEASFGYFLNEEILEIINVVTQLNYTLSELTTAAERVYTLEKMFNVREGLTRKDDSLPHRFMHEPIPEGPVEGSYIPENELNEMLDEYYHERKWDVRSGIPTDETIEKLGLGHLRQFQG